jgi:DNA polymerase elongation subunit (family B)
MSYVDALYDRDKDAIHIVERVNGKREYRTFPANYVFYYDDPKGKFRTIHGAPVSKFSTRNSKEFHKELKINSGRKVHESDIKPVLRCLEDNYLGAESPKLHTCFFDIEVDFDPERGYSSPSDPFNKITSVTLYLDWMDKLITLAIPPKSMSWETAEEIASKFDNTFLFNREEDMLVTFLDLIEDADILSGWNSEGFDIPYMVMRTIRVLSKNDTRRYCLWDQLPKQRMFERFGAENLTFDLIGRVHLDYMQLYRKYTYEERHSYSLDAIGEYELGERKTQFEGSLDQLYNQNFETFLDYNRQDVMLLVKMDHKLRFIDLANELAHDNTVLLPTTMGAVAVTEQAIINEAHQRGMVVPSRIRKDDKEDSQAAGAYVAYPKKGIHEYIGAIDLNSLYPSAIRALNMGPETIVGQVRLIMTDQAISERMNQGRSFADAWENMFGTLEYNAIMNMDVGVELTIDWEDGTSDVTSAANVWKLIFDSNQPWTISANGTIFRYDTKGIIPGLLERWYAERKEMQVKKKEATTPEDQAFWDKRQLVKKINLNSLYGAILNPHCRFFDGRIGQSTTLTGRIIAKHMDSFVNECITGEYDHVGESIIYGDTDSVYFSAWPAIKSEVESGRMEWDKDTCVQLYDTIADQVNDSFPAFMERACHCPRNMGSIIKAGRELVASKGLFIKKKRYAVLIYDNEGVRLDTHGKPGKVKAMGLDLKRSDTPRVVQDFLSEILLTTLTEKDAREKVIARVKEFKLEFAERPAWEKGTPKRVNNLTKYSAAETREGRANMPGHVRAAMNWNKLRSMHGDKYSVEIMDGMKVIVCKMKDNPLGYTSIAYPTDESHIPAWYKELPFDDNLMESTIVDQKVDNLLGVLEWSIAESTDIKTTFDSLFTWEE